VEDREEAAVTLAALAGLVIGWELLGRLEISMFIPPLSRVVAVWWQLLGDGTLPRAASSSLLSLVKGFVPAAVLGVVVGLAMGRFALVRHVLEGWVNALMSAPLSALVPILMILFGLGETTVILSVFLFAVWIIALDTQAGVANMQRSLEEMALSYGATSAQLYSKIIFWAALPEILAGIRIGFIRGVKGVVIGQLLVSIIGYGELFELYSRNFLLAEFWALTVLLFAFAMVVAEAVGAIEKRIEYYAGVRQ
jgi:NitT/TauT family transport system permease protein